MQTRSKSSTSQGTKRVTNEEPSMNKKFKGQIDMNNTAPKQSSTKKVNVNTESILDNVYLEPNVDSTINQTNNIHSTDIEANNVDKVDSAEDITFEFELMENSVIECSSSRSLKGLSISQSATVVERLNVSNHSKKANRKNHMPLNVFNKIIDDALPQTAMWPKIFFAVQ
jgi:hypothetical protein